MNGMTLLLLIYSGFTINLLLQCGLGIKGAVESKNQLQIETLVRALVIFFTVVLLWFFFSRVIYVLLPGILIYILLFPVSFIVFSGFEFIVYRFIKKINAENENLISSPEGITAVSVFLCINIANNILETIVLSFGFASGVFIITVIIREIRRRAVLEAVPLFLRGKPLVLITMGMLSLVFTTASLLIFRMISTG